jgi:hypothetical protein
MRLSDVKWRDAGGSVRYADVFDGKQHVRLVHRPQSYTLTVS